RAGVRGVALDGLDFAAAEVLLDEEHVLRAVGLAGPLHQADVARPRLTGPVAPGRVADDLLAVTAVPCVVEQVGAPGGLGDQFALLGSGLPHAPVDELGAPGGVVGAVELAVLVGVVPALAVADLAGRDLQNRGSGRDAHSSTSGV